MNGRTLNQLPETFEQDIRKKTIETYNNIRILATIAPHYVMKRSPTVEHFMHGCKITQEDILESFTNEHARQRQLALIFEKMMRQNINVILKKHKKEKAK